MHQSIYGKENKRNCQDWLAKDRKRNLLLQALRKVSERQVNKDRILHTSSGSKDLCGHLRLFGALDPVVDVLRPVRGCALR